MKTIIPCLLLGLLLPRGAQKALSGESEAASPGKQPATTGKVLVLENERTLEGDIERIGEQYRLRRAVGETWVPADRVLHLCNTNDEAYAFLRGRSNLADPDERLKLAQWCHQHAMRPQALSEVEAAVKLRPHHVASKRLLAHLQQLAALGTPGAVLPRPDLEPMPALNIELTGEALGQFTARVQPILMNGCASCHANGRGGAFKLQHVYEAGNRRMTQQNLAAVLAQINPHQPETSPFLVKGLSIHGEMAQAPFRNRQTPAYRALEDWVRLTLSNHQAVVEAVRNLAVPPGPPDRIAAVVAPAGGLLPPAGRKPALVPEPPPLSAAIPSEQTPSLPAGRPAAPILPETAPPAQPSKPSGEPPDRWDPEEFDRLNQGQPVPRSQGPGGTPDR